MENFSSQGEQYGETSSTWLLNSLGYFEPTNKFLIHRFTLYTIKYLILFSAEFCYQKL